MSKVYLHGSDYSSSNAREKNFNSEEHMSSLKRKQENFSRDDDIKNEFQSDKESYSDRKRNRSRSSNKRIHRYGDVEKNIRQARDDFSFQRGKEKRNMDDKESLEDDGMSYHREHGRERKDSHKERDETNVNKESHGSRRRREEEKTNKSERNPRDEDSKKLDSKIQIKLPRRSTSDDNDTMPVILSNRTQIVNTKIDIRIPNNASTREKWGKADEDIPKEPEEEVVKVKADFGLSGALAKDVSTGNVVNGVLLKYTEPIDAALPTLQWRFYVFKNDEVVETQYIHRKSCYYIGRNDQIADIVTAHSSCSKQHAVLQYRAIQSKDEYDNKIVIVKPYIIDLGSANKTFLNGVVIEDAKYYELREKDVIKFGASTREYILLHGDSAK